MMEAKTKSQSLRPVARPQARETDRESQKRVKNPNNQYEQLQNGVPDEGSDSEEAAWKFRR